MMDILLSLGKLIRTYFVESYQRRDRPAFTDYGGRSQRRKGEDFLALVSWQVFRKLRRKKLQ
jgi:hypothetical protein